MMSKSAESVTSRAIENLLLEESMFPHKLDDRILRLSSRVRDLGQCIEERSKSIAISLCLAAPAFALSGLQNYLLLNGKFHDDVFAGSLALGGVATFLGGSMLFVHAIKQQGLRALETAELAALTTSLANFYLTPQSENPTPR